MKAETPETEAVNKEENKEGVATNKDVEEGEKDTKVGVKDKEREKGTKEGVEDVNDGVEDKEGEKDTKEGVEDVKEGAKGTKEGVEDKDGEENGKERKNTKTENKEQVTSSGDTKDAAVEERDSGASDTEWRGPSPLMMAGLCSKWSSSKVGAGAVLAALRPVKTSAWHSIIILFYKMVYTTIKNHILLFDLLTLYLNPSLLA